MSLPCPLQTIPPSPEELSGSARNAASQDTHSRYPAISLYDEESPITLPEFQVTQPVIWSGLSINNNLMEVHEQSSPGVLPTASSTAAQGSDQHSRPPSLSTSTNIPLDVPDPQNIPSSAGLTHLPPSSSDSQADVDPSPHHPRGFGEAHTSQPPSRGPVAGAQIDLAGQQLEAHQHGLQQYTEIPDDVGISTHDTASYYPWFQPHPSMHQFTNHPQEPTSPTGPRPFQAFEEYGAFSPPASALGLSVGSGPHQHSSPQAPPSPYPIHSPSGPMYGYPYAPGAFSMPAYHHPASYAGHPYPHYGSPPNQNQNMWWYVPQGLPHHFGNQPYYSPHPPSLPPPLSAPTPQAPPAQAEPSYHLQTPAPPIGPIHAAARARSFSSPSAPQTPSEDARVTGVHHGADRPLPRYPFRPNPPAVRSEWVMWIGNVPADASYDELWRFFHTPPDEALPSWEPQSVGIMSMFIISRSCCAFVNFGTEEQLQSAVARFDGRILRPDEPRSSPLVCRIRRPDDYYKSGVAGQRGAGMHTKWVKDKKQPAPGRHESHARSASESRISSDAVGPALSEMSEERPSQEGSRGSGSYASTNSSILSKYFPQRYFILKSLSQYDLDLSAEKGLWATQRHNEGVLDQAYRTSKDVFLIFSVNQSGEWYGYARMAGPIRRGEAKVPWSTQRPVLPARRASGGALGLERAQQHTRRLSDSNLFFKPAELRMVDRSPQPMTSAEEAKAESITAPDDAPSQPAGDLSSPTPPRQPSVDAAEVRHSAPAQFGETRQDISFQSPPAKHSLDQHLQAIPSQRHQAAKERLVANPTSSVGLDAASTPASVLTDMGTTYEGVGGLGMAYGRRHSILGSVQEEETTDQGMREEIRRGKMKESSPALMSPDQSSISRSSSEYPAGFRRPPEDWDENKMDQEFEKISPDTWGKSFKVEWLCTRKLPFWRTRYLRNAWNYGREVKICRDGTEVEPGTGRMLLLEWEREPDEHRALYEMRYGETLPLKLEQREGYEAWRSGAFRQPHVRQPSQPDYIEPSSSTTQQEPAQGPTSGNDDEETQQPIKSEGQGSVSGE